MSYPHQVPEGWTKGESLYAVNRYGPRFALRRKINFSGMTEPSAPVSDSVYAIEFDSAKDVENFLKWWNDV